MYQPLLVGLLLLRVRRPITAIQPNATPEPAKTTPDTPDCEGSCG